MIVLAVKTVENTWSVFNLIHYLIDRQVHVPSERPRSNAGNQSDAFYQSTAITQIPIDTLYIHTSFVQLK